MSVAADNRTPAAFRREDLFGVQYDSKFISLTPVHECVLVTLNTQSSVRGLILRNECKFQTTRNTSASVKRQVCGSRIQVMCNSGDEAHPVPLTRSQKNPQQLGSGVLQNATSKAGT